MVKISDVPPEVWVAAVSALAAVVTVVAALSKGARLRHRAEMLRNEMAVSTVPHDRAVLLSLHREAMAQIVARLAVRPWRLCVVLILYLLGLPMATFAASWSAVEVRAHLDPDWNGVHAAHVPWPILALLITLALLLLLVGTSELLKCRIERVRVEKLYLDGRDVDRSLLKARGLRPSAEDLAWAMDGTISSGRRARRRMGFEVWWLSLIPWVLMLCAGFLLPGGSDPAAVAQAFSMMMLILILGLPVSKSAVLTNFDRTPVLDDWVHPRPPSPAEQIRTEIEMAQRSGPPSLRSGLNRIFHRGR